MSIYIFSRPVQSGKTTELLEWCNLQKNIHGILMPDINGRRKVFNLNTKEIFDAECIDTANTKEPLTSIGKFYFYTAAFEKANSILLHAISQTPNWLVIDEAGKLELKGEGFYRSVDEAVRLYSDKNKLGSLLITVRDGLCEEVISFFNIKKFKIINRLDTIT
jgi:nucleoside-triphosphatase THEP1